MKVSQFDRNYNWYKGNLHSHSTVSDGKLSPEELARVYYENGWSFLAITDHSIYSYWKELEREDFVIIPGVEIAVDEPERPRCYHFVGVSKLFSGKNTKERVDEIPWNGRGIIQDAISLLKSKGMFVFLCHPIWSRTELEDFKDLVGYFGIEIYNNGCELENHTGFSTIYWDSLLRRGRKVWGIAVDDNHNRIDDSLGGWVMVNAPRLKAPDIVDAILEGRFYSSTGPSIYDFGVEDGEVYIECSKVKAIHFVTYEPRGRSYYAGKDGYLTSARFKLSGEELYVRAECIDENGKIAWTNPIFLA